MNNPQIKKIQQKLLKQQHLKSNSNMEANGFQIIINAHIYAVLQKANKYSEKIFFYLISPDAITVFFNSLFLSGSRIKGSLPVQCQ